MRRANVGPVRSPEIDELVVRARGLELVRRLLAERGASSAELEEHSRELRRTREQLAAALVG